MPFQYFKQYWLPISRLVQTSMKRESQWENFLSTKYVKFMQSLLIFADSVEEVFAMYNTSLQNPWRRAL